MKEKKCLLCCKSFYGRKKQIYCSQLCSGRGIAKEGKSGIQNLSRQSIEKRSRTKTGKKMSAEFCRASSDRQKGRIFSDEHKQALRKQHKTPQLSEELREAMRERCRERIGTPMPLNSPVGAHENNIRAKTWWFIKNKKHYKFKNLSHFIRTHQFLFDKEDLISSNGKIGKCKAYIGLTQLLMVDKNGVPKNQSHFWHGWTIGDKDIIIRMDGGDYV